MKFITYSREMGMAVGRWRYSEYITSYIILTCGIMLIFLECAVGLTHWVNTWRIMGAKNSEHTRACILVSKHHSPVKRTGLLGDMANSTSQEGRDNMSLVHISCGVRKQVSGQHHLNQWSIPIPSPPSLSSLPRDPAFSLSSAAGIAASEGTRLSQGLYPGLQVAGHQVTCFCSFSGTWLPGGHYPGDLEGVTWMRPVWVSWGCRN